MMNQLKDDFNPGFAVGGRIRGYVIEKIIELPEIKAVFYQLDHPATGARHIHISAPDPENVFSVGFKTVPRDSTGVAHILEHTVLCGSAKYPVRDPFFSMIKRSLNTFMNALTASDWTMYPFSTQNRKDYYNLMSVYLDSAFFPNIDRLSFHQEGHRLEFETDAASGKPRLSYKGVVYNEMKGAMSSPDQIMGRAILNALYPDTTYGFNSGGDPAQIPKLTHDDLMAFHRRHYHPSNAYFYTYGNFPIEAHLEFIEDAVLTRFKRINPDTDVTAQPRWDRSRTATYRYPLDPAEDSTNKAQFCLAWLTADIRDAFEVLGLSVLEHVLMGNPGSPLRKALLDSGLGSNLSDGTGYDADNKDTMFACGLKDVDPDETGRIESLIMDTLAGLAENGIDRKLVDSAIHQIEFHQKEITNSPYPYGLKLLMRFSGDWFHGGEPWVALKFDDLIHRLFEELDKGPFLEDRIRSYFLENPHQVRLTLLPDPELAENERLRVEKELEDVARRLSEDDIERIKQDARALMESQDADEDLSCLPTLAIGDIPPEINMVTESGHCGDMPALCYAQPTSGIFYFSCAVDLTALPPELIPLMPFYTNCLLRTGTTKHHYGEIGQLIDLYTGGIGVSVNAGAGFIDPSPASCFPFLWFNAKCLSRNLENMFDLGTELLCCTDFSDLGLLKRLILEYRSNLESAVISSGHMFAISLASRNFSAAGDLNETWHGIHQLKMVKQLTEELTDENLKTISENLYRISRMILAPEKNMHIALIGEENDLARAQDLTRAMLAEMKGNGNIEKNAPPPSFPGAPIREGWHTSTAVSFVASVFETEKLHHEDAPALAVISKLLRSMFLHREIREKGGAYGGFAGYQMESGLFYFGSYRDPHIAQTLAVYDAAADFITSGNYSDDNITESILQVCADIDKPHTPAAGAMKAFYRKCIGLSDDLRKNFKQRLLELDKNQILAVANKHFSPGSHRSSVAVISSETALKSANDQLNGPPLVLHRI
jgi:presequence protease